MRLTSPAEQAGAPATSGAPHHPSAGGAGLRRPPSGPGAAGAVVGPAGPHGLVALPPEPVGSGRWTRLRHRIGLYVALTKPRVIELLLVTTVPTMLLAQRGLPPLWLIAATLAGGAGGAGAANVLNCYIDRDIDRVMNRTRRRATATGVVSPRAALTFGLVLAAASLTFLWLVVNPASAVLTAAAILIYVVGYTLLLKRRTPQNIVWGGAAGCFPVLIGWSAVTGGVSWAAALLFGVVFFWTPPHYWPLSMKYKDQYDDVDVPMLGVTRSGSQVGLQVILYAWATVATSLLLIPVANMGLVYTTSALVFGGWFIYESHRLYGRAVRGTEPRPMRVFHASITYLTLLFVAIAIDPLLPF